MLLVALLKLQVELFEEEDALQAMADTLSAPFYRQTDNLSLL